MDQHPVPRQITTFEFKLIGFLTIKQFGYLAFFSILGFIVFNLVPVPFLNYFCGIGTFLIGVVIVFVPINDRPFDIWVQNFIKRLLSPSQYYFHKKNDPPDFLRDVFSYSTPHIVATHIDAQEKLSTYLQKTNNPSSPVQAEKQIVYTALNAATVKVSPVSLPSDETPTMPENTTFPEIVEKDPQPQPQSPKIASTQAGLTHPFLHGLIKNNKDIPLPNILVYVKDELGSIIRILKTNHHGVFATYHLLPAKNYVFELKDSEQRFFFDTMEYTVADKNETPLLFYSRELL